MNWSMIFIIFFFVNKEPKLAAEINDPFQKERSVEDGRERNPS